MTSIRTLFRTSTPIHDKANKRLPYPVNIADILYDPRGIQVPQQDVIAAPGLQGNIGRGQRRLNQMAQNQNQNRNNRALSGADPALAQILTRMQNRDEQQDNTRKKLLMFPKNAFDGTF